jgi:hypothetical protein
LRYLVGGGRQHPRLRAGVAFPGQELLEGKALPDEDPTPELFVGPEDGWMAIEKICCWLILPLLDPM